MSGNKSAIIATWFGNDKGNLIKPKLVTSGWDYLFFTDFRPIEEKTWIWRKMSVKTPHIDPEAASKWIKILFPVLFPQYEKSVYIDSEKYLIDRDLDEFYAAVAGNNEYAAVKHRVSDCTYEEIDRNIKRRSDKITNLKAIRQLNIEAELPKNSGLFDNSMILRLHTDRLKQCMAAWADALAVCKRDQCSIMMCLKKFSVNYGYCRSRMYVKYSALRALSNIYV